MTRLRPNSTRSFFRLATLVLACGLAAGVAADDDPSNGSTPEAIKPGGPAGSYSLSGFENINYYNGSLNISLPLHPVQGRGKAAMNVTLAIDQHWTVRSTVLGDPKPGTQWWSDFLPGYGPGMVLARKVADGQFCGGGGILQTSLTRITFISSDRTEYEFRDVQTDGQPLFKDCFAPVPQRGQDFVTFDGTAATFHSDTVISDGVVNQQGNTATTQRVTGDLMLRDGTHYRVVNGLVTKMRDKNGNELSFDYFESGTVKPRVTQITDSLKRLVTFQYLADRDLIDFKGFGGAARTVTVFRTTLSNAFRPDSGYTVQTLQQLFPGLAQLPTVHNPVVASGVVLPNGQAYTFFYNPYSEVEDVFLPTGGRFHYTYWAGLQDGDPSGWFSTVQNFQRLAIYRRVQDRTVYGNSGIELVTKISRPETTTGTQGFVDADQRNASNALIRRERHYFFGSAAVSLAQRSTDYAAFKDGKEYKTEIRTPADAVLHRVEHVWVQRAPVAWWTGPQDAAPAKDPRISQTKTTLNNGGFSFKTFTYDTYNNRTSTSEFNFGADPELPSNQPVRRTETTYVTTNGSNNYATEFAIHIRDLPRMERLLQSNGTTPPVERAKTTYEYDVYGGTPPNALLVPRTGISGLDPLFADTGRITRGNRTATILTLDTPVGEVRTYLNYDVAGNVVRTINGRNFTTTFDFIDKFGGPDGNAGGNAPPPELGSETTFAFATSTANPKGHVTRAQFDYYLGRVVDAANANGTVDSFFFADTLDRPTRIKRAQLSYTSFTYDDMPGNPRILTRTDKDALDDAKMRVDVVFDSLGREVAKRVFEQATDTAFIVTEARNYDALSRITARYNPFRFANGLPAEPVYSTSIKYDELDRVVEVKGPDNTPATTSYVGNQTTVSDGAGHVRASFADALGRVLAVVEDPAGLNYTTTYSYDVLNNLTKVVQSGQERTFAYDSLGRLICSSTPESRIGTASCAGPTLPTAGLTRYSYDPNGNLTGRTDARTIGGNQVTSTYGYDELDRIFSKSYNDGTPSATFAYDAAIMGTGRFKSVSSTIGGQAWGMAHDEYDAFGHVKTSRQTAAGVDYRFDYTYDRADNLLTEKYPSGRVVTSTYDLVSRQRTVAEGAYTYGTVPGDGDYSSHGAVVGLRFGLDVAPRLWRVARFNCYLQQRFAGLGSANGVPDVLGIELQHGTDNNCQDTNDPAGNNGNLLHEKILVNSLNVVRFTRDYGYDNVNRLTSARELQGTTQIWAQTYSQGFVGNRAVNPGSYIPSPNLTPTALNQFSAANRISISGWAYDNAGNLTTDGAGQTFTYDAENRQVTAGSTSYLYDGEGRRVRKSVSGTPTIFVYDTLGRLAAEYGTANAILGTKFVVPDHLGSTRLTTADEFFTSASLAKAARHDYLPFGEELLATGPFGRADYNMDQSVRHRFTGKERDLESGLDYFGARYVSGPQGRFTGADPETNWRADIADPQRWNRYPYARNNPLAYVDPDGRETVLVHGRRVSDNVFGHIAISINGRIFSYGTNATHGSKFVKDWDRNEQAYLADQHEIRLTDRMILNVTDAQEQALLKDLKEHNPNAKGAPPYSLANNSCVTVCEQALERAGILPNEPGPVRIDHAGNELQAGAPKSFTPSDLAAQVTSAGLVKSVKTEGHEKVSWLRSVFNTIKEAFK